MRRTSLTLLTLSLSLFISQANAQTFTKKQIVKSGASTCVLASGKWKVAQKNGKIYQLKAKPKKVEKALCNALLKPSKAFSLDDLPSVTALVQSATSASTIHTSVASGTPPSLTEIASVGAATLFWRNGVVSDVASGSPNNQSCSEFFGGHSDGESSGFQGCYATQGVGYSFENILSGGTALCYMQNVPTSAVQRAGGITLLSGTLPGGAINKLFETPAGNKARLVQVNAGNQKIFLKIAAASENSKKGHQYGYELFFCNGNKARSEEYERSFVTLGGTFQSVSYHDFDQGLEEGQAGSRVELTATLKRINGKLAFDTNTTRHALFVGITPDNSFISDLEISGGNLIFNKFRDSSEFGNRKGYSVSSFRGEDMGSLRFIEGASKEKRSDQGQTVTSTGGIEFRDSFYASAPTNNLISQLDAVNLETEAFYSTDFRVGHGESIDCASATPDITLAMDYDNEAVSEIQAKCEADVLDNMNFCETEQLEQAQQQFNSVCIQNP